MATTIKQQVSLDEALVPSVQSPRTQGQSFAELPFEEEILEFLRFLGHSTQIKTLTDVNVNKLYQLWRSFAAVINKCLTGKSIGFDSLRLSQAQILWGLYYNKNIDYAFLIWEDLVYQVEHKNQKKSNEMNSKAYKEYYACATGEAAPKPKASARKKKGGSASSTTLPTPIATPTPTTTVMLKEQKPNSSRLYSEEANKRRIFLSNVVLVNDDDDDEEEVSKMGEQEATESDEGDDEATESDRESEDEKTREQEEESFDPIPRTPEDNEDDDNNEEDQGLRIGEEERRQEEEKADELYRDVDINQGRGLQVSQEIKDSHVTLTPTHSDGQQESSATSSFMTNLLNPIIDPDRVKFLEDNFSNIPGIVNQYMHQQIPEAVREAVQTQTDRLQDSIQRENDEFLKTIDDNMKKIIKEQVKTQVKAQVTRILPRIEEKQVYPAIQRSDEQRNLYKALVKAYDADKTILDTYGESAILKRRREDDDQEGPFAGSDLGSKSKREGGEHASASTPSKPATGSAGRSTTGTQSQQLSASESAFAEEPIQTTCQMEDPSHPVFETGVEDQPIVQTSQHPEWFSQPSKPLTPDCDWNKSVPAAQGNAQS
uniref:Uncharacterized protein n=1 Tax=Tanacetum cinerariifolium TaxID=118510 RepID=A0A6L2MX21_TANCI|nr:hypothetical protein [Tanacetum cinerariifolium]